MRADRRDLRVGEDRCRNRPIVRGRVAARRCSPPQRAPGTCRGASGARHRRVADRPYAVPGAQPVVDGDPAARDLDVELLEAEPVDVRRCARWRRAAARLRAGRRSRGPPARPSRPPRRARRGRSTGRGSRPRSKRSPRASPASGSSFASRRSFVSTIVTRRAQPMRRTARARPRPGRRRARRGSRARRLAQTASRFVQYVTSSRPSTGGTAGDDPVATTRFLVLDLALADRDEPRPRDPRLAPHELGALLGEPVRHARSRRGRR